jgi:hypothetical protein
MAVYAVVDTLTENFDDIRQVRFLVNSKEQQSLAGHLDFSRKFSKRVDLIRQ